MLTSLYYDHMKEFPPLRTNHVGHSLVHSLKGRVGDHKQLLAGLNESLKVRDEDWVSVEVKLRIGSGLCVEGGVGHS